MKAIYKYENKINHKLYVGQTNNLERRYREHLCGQSKGTSLLEKAIKKYGIENFSFEVIEWTDEPDKQEQYWICYYNCYKPYGYNIAKGGGFLPNQQGENHSQVTITEKTALSIQKDLMNWDIPCRQIVKKYKTTQKVVENIKSGHTWNYYNLEYPLRPTERFLNEIRAEEVVRLIQTTKLSFTEIARQVGWGTSQISMINSGKNHHQENLDYPLR